MTIKAGKLRESMVPEPRRLYQIHSSRKIVVEEKQRDNSLDQVVLEYCIQNDDIGYFAKEYRPMDVAKTGAKVIDITAAVLNHAKKSARWHLYDIKDTLAGEKTIISLYNQWNAGFGYLKHNILGCISGYSVIPDLGVITRSYDEERMKRLRNDCQKRCDEFEHDRQAMTLAKRKKGLGIAKDRAALRAARAILERTFQAEGGLDTYKINIRLLQAENQVYKMKFPV